jgi:hypothetical protein
MGDQERSLRGGEGPGGGPTKTPPLTLVEEFEMNPLDKWRKWVLGGGPGEGGARTNAACVRGGRFWG